MSDLLEAKACGSCQQPKALDAFYLRQGKPDSWCKACRVSYVQQRRVSGQVVRKREPGANARQRRYFQTANAQMRHTDNQRNRRARKAAVQYEHIKSSEVLIRSQGLCGICLEQITGEFHVDHIVPLVKLGPHTYANVQAAHPACNLQKGSK